MKNTLQINASFDRPDLLEKMVEQLAHTYNDAFMTKAVGEWQPVETSSTETFVSGTVRFADDQNDPINFPFITRFLFTCLHEQNVPNKLHWGASFN